MRNKLAVKICGMNSQTAIDAAIASGVDYLGFVFFPPSPRSLTPEIASSLMEKRSDDFKVVAVVVNPSDKLLEEITYHLAPDIFQLHGSETADDIEKIKQKLILINLILPGFSVINSFCSSINVKLQGLSNPLIILSSLKLSALRFVENNIKIISIFFILLK